LNNEERIKICYSRSLYRTYKYNMKREKSDEYKYQCCYTITIKDGMKCFYSSEKKRHFNIPKVIWSNETCEYGLT
jgi:hypothetical protein